MNRLGSQELEGALATLGDYLESQGMAYELVVVGGGSSLLQGTCAVPRKIWTSWHGSRSARMSPRSHFQGFDERKEVRRYGGLTLHLAGRLDQIAFKLYAAVDLGPRSKHVRDLKDLVPTGDELLFGARWSVTHDPSPAFRDQLVQALASLGVTDASF